MAKTNGLNACVSLHKARQHSHGVGVVKEKGARTNGRHIVGKVLKNRDGAQCAEDAADSEGVGNGLAKTILLGHLKIGNGAGLIKADLNGINYKISAAQCITAVFDAKILADFGTSVVDIFVKGHNHGVGFLKTVGVDVVKRIFKIRERITHHGVTDDIFGKYGASRTHKCNLSHFLARLLPLSFFVFCKSYCIYSSLVV